MKHKDKFNKEIEKAVKKYHLRQHHLSDKEKIRYVGLLALRVYAAVKEYGYKLGDIEAVILEHI